jgi:hypothetical protein
LINPLLDLLIVGLNWSNVTSGEIQLENFKALVKGYNQIQKKRKSFTLDIFKGYMGYCLDWLIYNIKQSGVNMKAASEATKTLRAMHAVERNQQSLIRV